MAQGNPLPGEKYLHFKNRMYQVIAVAYHSETMEPYVVYQALYGDFKMYIRPYDMFVSEVDHEKYPEVQQRYRFQYIPETDEGKQSGAGESVNVNIRKQSDAGERTETAGEEEQRPRRVLKILRAEENRSDKPDDLTSLAEEPEERMNPWLEKFLDAKEFEEKYKVVCDMQRDVTDRLIDDIAVVMDLAIPEGELQERYGQLKYCMRTRQKYEMGRLR